MGEFDDKLSAILSNQEAMGQIMALAQSLSGGKQGSEEQEDMYVPLRQSVEGGAPSAAVDPSDLLNGLDPRLIQVGIRLLREYNRADDRNAALLMALRPFVKEERFAKVDRAVQIARLSRVIRVLFEVMNENGGELRV